VRIAQVLLLFLLVAAIESGLEADSASGAGSPRRGGGKAGPSPAPLAPICADNKCDAPLDPTVWTGAWTGGNGALIADAALPVAGWNAGIAPNNNTIAIDACANNNHAVQSHHAIVPAGNDPEIPGLKTVAPTPAANPASMRLGNRCTQYGGERVTKTFTVQPGATSLEFWYATVLQIPNAHSDSQLPGFGAYLFNGSSLLTNRVDIDPTTAGYQGFVAAADPTKNPFFAFKSATDHSVVYRDWTCVTVDLSGLEGQTLTLVFVNRDCTLSAHWGYSYIDSLCLGCKGNTTGDASFSQATSKCSEGRLCFDYTVPQTTLGVTGTVSLTLEVYQNGQLVNALNAGPFATSGNYCFTAANAGVNAALGYDWRATANFTITGATISPKVIGKSGTGTVEGANNDCTPPINPCCPPWNPDRLAEMLFYSGSGPINAPYTLHFAPTTLFKSQIQAYINYLHTINPAIASITIDWRLHDQGIGVTPTVPYGPQLGVTAYTTWTAGGNGTPAIAGDPNFFSVLNPPNPPNLFPMVVGTWYRVHTGIYLENGQSFFPESCGDNEIWVRVQVLTKAGGSVPQPVLEMWNWSAPMRRIPLAELPH
jgi:hypothetical protein